MNRLVSRPGAALAAVLTLTACGNDPPPAVIGFLFPAWGGRNVSVARDELAARDLSDRIRIVYDSIRDEDPAEIEVERAAELLAVEGLVAATGPGGSRGALLAAPLFDDAGVPLVVPTGTSRALGEAGDWTFAMAPNDSVEGAFIAGWVEERTEARSATVFFVNDEFGRGLRDGFIAAVDTSVVRIVDVVPVSEGSDVEALAVTSFRGAPSDVIVLATREEAAGRIMRTLYELDETLMFIGGDGLELGDRLAEAAGESLKSLCVVSFWTPASPSARSREFVERYRRVLGTEPQAEHAMRHDAIMLLVAAIVEVGPDPESIRGYLGELGVRRPPYPGVTGPIDFTPDREVSLIMVSALDGSPVGPP